MSAPPEQEDVARRQSFRDFVEPEIEVLLRVARAMTNYGPDAEDLVQETLIRAYRGVHRFDGAHPRAWLLTILRNTHANMHRRRRPVVMDTEDLHGGFRPAFGAADAPSAEDAVLDLEVDSELSAAIASLDTKFRTVLILVDVDGLSYSEASAVLGVPLGTVMSRLSRARDRVRRQLVSSHWSQGRLS